MILSDSGNTSFEQPPAGTHVGRCIAVIDLGTQRGEYLGEPQIKRQLVLRWELPSELMADGENKGKPFTVGRFYNASLNEKATLRKDLANWRGKDFSKEELKGFDIANLLGKACMLGITVGENGKAKVSSVMALPKGMSVSNQVNDSFHFSLNSDEFKHSLFDELPKGFKAMVEKSPEYQALVKRVSSPAPEQRGSTGSGFDDLDSDCPF